MKNILKRPSKLLALAALAGLGLLTACDDSANSQSPGPQPPAVTVAKPVVKKIMERDDFTGRFEAVDDVNVRARVTGYLEKIHFTEGSLVQEGDLLVTIDQRPYQTQLNEALANLDVAQTQFDLAEQELERAQTLIKRGNISQATLDERNQQFASAKAQIEGAKAAVNRARLDLEFTEVRAPISGRIGQKGISIGNLVNANETILANIVSQSPIHFYFDVDERSYLAYARMARNGGGANRQTVTVTLTDEREGDLTGYLDFVDNRVDEATGTVRIRAVFDNADMILQPGLFGRISIPGSPLYQGILIPDEAIGSDQDRRIVYLVGNDNAVSPQIVRPGPRIDGYRVIREGLTGTEIIVVNGLMRVRPGVTVTPQMTELPPVKQ
ncbi:efflux RND transporter periplasmic adaptor subunit [Aestuariispira insulae]|uniref:RND family efflux transporter MFP subunit n=1 Tax=Aestuariispira insulae TaxID=1461337 RepID=A0A3D9HFL5_9PROT|nr:efflux RND transporter periplasmic adaptor subunit [Aestuariispira insulae]RED48041.1 RND family efflux transporter MFP subunit [Aestuariispira insulae]